MAKGSSKLVIKGGGASKEKGGVMKSGGRKRAGKGFGGKK